jgi:hypothetical protein
MVIDSGLGVISEGGERRALGGVPREQKMLKENLSRVTYHQVYLYAKITCFCLHMNAGLPE